MNNQQTTDQPVEYTPSPEPRSIMDNLKFWQLSTLALFLFFIITLGAYVYTITRPPSPRFIPPITVLPSPPVTQVSSDETANWKTYINTKIRFTFKYPETWTEKGPVAESDRTIVYIHAGEKFGEGPEGLQYYLWVSDVDKLPELESTKESIGDYNVYKTDKWPSRFGALSYSITRDERQYIVISFTPYDLEKPYPAQDRYLNIFDKILSTFKFLD